MSNREWKRLFKIWKEHFDKDEILPSPREVLVQSAPRHYRQISMKGVIDMWPSSQVEDYKTRLESVGVMAVEHFALDRIGQHRFLSVVYGHRGDEEKQVAQIITGSAHDHKKWGNPDRAWVYGSHEVIRIIADAGFQEHIHLSFHHCTLALPETDDGDSFWDYVPQRGKEAEAVVIRAAKEWSTCLDEYVLVRVQRVAEEFVPDNVIPFPAR